MFGKGGLQTVQSATSARWASSNVCNSVRSLSGSRNFRVCVDVWTSYNLPLAGNLTFTFSNTSLGLLKASDRHLPICVHAPRCVGGHVSQSAGRVWWKAGLARCEPQRARRSAAELLSARENI